MYNQEKHAYVKHVNEKEMRITLLACKSGIAPALVEPVTDAGVDSFGDNLYKIVLEAYPKTFYTLPEDVDGWVVYGKQLTEKLDALHSLGIVHADLHSLNIVVNPITEQVRLIDFGESLFVAKSTVCDLEILYTDQYGPRIRKKEDVYAREMYEVEFRANDYDWEWMMHNRPCICDGCGADSIAKWCDMCTDYDIGHFCSECLVKEGHNSKTFFCKECSETPCNAWQSHVPGLCFFCQGDAELMPSWIREEFLWFQRKK